MNFFTKNKRHFLGRQKQILLKHHLKIDERPTVNQAVRNVDYTLYMPEIRRYSNKRQYLLCSMNTENVLLMTQTFGSFFATWESSDLFKNKNKCQSIATKCLFICRCWSLECTTGRQRYRDTRVQCKWHTIRINELLMTCISIQATTSDFDKNKKVSWNGEARGYVCTVCKESSRIKNILYSKSSDPSTLAFNRSSSIRGDPLINCFHTNSD